MKRTLDGADDTLPPRIRDLPMDPDRRVPVPWFASWVDGKPEFRYVDPQRLTQAVRFGWCWVCGQPMGRMRAFLIGPMCAVNRVSSEPPSHRDCAVYSATHCPFLVNPRSVRRTTGVPDAAAGRLEQPAGTMLLRNPGVALVWVTRRYQLEREPNGVLFRLGDPEETLWFAERRVATRAEVMASIESGYPLLLEVATSESPAAVRELESMRDAAMRWLPA
jgi:hypothetical protein